jgi:glycosyltransferase involved in cell wall biosynthesis
MRLGVVWQPGPNAQYRAFQPMRMMARRGHEVVWPPTEQGEADFGRLSTCDAIHVYRRADPATLHTLAELRRVGVPIVYDNDDDYAALPWTKRDRQYKSLGGLKGHQQFLTTVKLARKAEVFTTTSPVLAEKYRRAGVDRVEVIPNHLVPDAHRPRHAHAGVVVGWIAGLEHKVDAAHVGIARTLRELIAEHDDVSVDCVGLDLGLPERYRHARWLDFEELPARIGGFDVGLAPLRDTPMNRSRSDIKLKEYAASGVPWLASPVGPYRGFGEEQGGWLVPDDGWPEALRRLVTNAEERERLGANGVRWARSQTVEAAADLWEAVFAAAAGRGRRVTATPRGGLSVRLPASGTR